MYNLKEPTIRSHLIVHAFTVDIPQYGVATISRLLKMLFLFCKRALKKRLYSAVNACIHSRYSTVDIPQYGVATISNLLKMLFLFCKRAL